MEEYNKNKRNVDELKQRRKELTEKLRDIDDSINEYVELALGFMSGILDGILLDKYGIESNLYEMDIDVENELITITVTGHDEIEWVSWKNGKFYLHTNDIGTIPCYDGINDVVRYIKYYKN